MSRDKRALATMVAYDYGHVLTAVILSVIRILPNNISSYDFSYDPLQLTMAQLLLLVRVLIGTTFFFFNKMDP